jgi:Ca-activated chloride channel family protein
VPATRANLAKAQAFLSRTSGNGGTEMMTAIKAALEPSDDQSHVRIVCFMTDGYVGNDMEIIRKCRNIRTPVSFRLASVPL